ncbi:unnamed protein product [Calypogeia fissa]
MMEHVLQFLQYGAPVEPIGQLSSSVTAPFLPSLALSASDSPTLIPHLLPSLYNVRQVRNALVYAGLDYVDIAQSVLEDEAKEEAATTASAAGNVPSGVLVPAAAPELEQEEDELRDEEWTWVNDDETDECNNFEVADEKARVRMAILSLRRRARDFEKEESQHLERDEGSMWSRDACLPELLCLLPVTVSRCPTLLSPEILVEGLLAASCGCPLLVTTFANNPAIVERGVLAMANVLSREIETQDNRPGSPHASESAASTGKALGGGTLAREHSGLQSHEFAPPQSASSCAQAVVSVLVSLCRLAPSFAAICREALVHTCTLAEMALHITLEIFHDELQFLSKLTFPKERTSRWILAFLAVNQKHGDSQPPLISPGSLAEKVAEAPPSENKGTSLTQSTPKGVATRVLDALLADAKSTWKEKGWCGRLHAHLRLYCVLIRAGDLQPTHEEVDFWLRLLGGTMDQSGGELKHAVKSAFVSERTLQLGISFVCLVPGLSSSSTKSLLHTCIANLLRAAMGNANYADCTPEIELAVWVAVQLLLRRFADVAGLVREALGMHVTVHTASMRDVADAAVAAAVLSDPFVAANAAASLRPSGPVPSYRKHHCLGLKCLEQLLSTSTFARCGVDISDAVMHYICIAGEPIHPVLPSIVQGFTDLSVPAPRARGGLPRFRMRPFSRDALVKALAPGFAMLRNSSSNNKESRINGFPGSIKSNKKGPETKIGHGNPLATAALITYYILSREQIVRSMGVSGGSNNDSRSSLVDDGDDGWWTELLGSLPLRELLMYMETNWPAYEHLLPQWLSTASVVFPERFTAQALLQDLENTDASFQTHVADVPVTNDLEWVGPPPATFLPKIEEEMVGVSVEKVDTPAVSQGFQPEVFPAVDGLNINDPKVENSESPMDVDKEPLDVVLAKPSEDAKEEAKTESSTTDAVDANLLSNKNRFSMQDIAAIMQKAVENPLPAMRILTAMTSSPTLVTDIDGGEDVGILAEFGVYWQMKAAIVKALVPNLLEDSCPRCLQDQFCSWWRTLPSSILEYLVPVLWDLVRDPGVPGCGDSGGLRTGHQYAQLRQSIKRPGSAVVTLSTSGFAAEPLKFLACDVKVFRSPLLGLILDLLLELLVANERICMAAATDGGRDAGIKKDEVAAALVAQDSAVCQILLEACLPKSELNDEKRPGPMLEARKLICATLCSMFSRSRLLLKLIHFQGYDIELIPMMVEGVPDMVQCLEFIGELLQQSLQHQQVFAVALTAQLINFYPDLPQSLTAAQQVVGQVTQVRTKVAGCASYLQEVLGPVAQCASTFPSLATQVVALLQSCAQAGGPLTRSAPPRDAALHSAAVAAFKYLIQSKLLHGRPPSAI